ncbi:MAG: hypothetical protein GY924_19455 [Planctomycetaceae bacterium]|nr:hypothetical protein [Planctomycetaceae bacterium]
MQPSELWRRGVVMPHSPEVADQIAAWDVDESTMVEFLPIADQSLFDQLWDIGLFKDINQACGTLIDDYEAEWLPPEHLPSAANAVARLLDHNPNGEVGDFLRRLSLLIGAAVQAHMPLYFEC